MRGDQEWYVYVLTAGFTINAFHRYESRAATSSHAQGNHEDKERDAHQRLLCLKFVRKTTYIALAPSGVYMKSM